MRCGRMGWSGLLAVMLALLPLAAEAQYLTPRHGQAYGGDFGGPVPDRFIERRGGTLRHYDSWGTYEGRTERSAGGGVVRHYDADGRYLGRDEVNRDFRRRPPSTGAWGSNGQDGQGSPGVQLYLDPGLMQPPPEMRPEFPASRGTPWFNNGSRR
ncbi:hypothetical protein [Teichococcus vastitatis]|uniref:Uncharacterized protein n=1 Tax=Teichococcus vastitatis TaxID=2307076 RepID=A0ABS9WC41_9PROT|nr:hypothetical protein [Pseudoroseomonas vastitatis]MCI0756877.1 hypothetical protein [Pseudoroseomonas vastitatis]